ncbi:hypothetical protein DHEL01_v200686 [Diaporthe helianthi]|uniref:Uncharacterized protein n=1 Tax=Diaporthe helianthi TaxID=158607 RepID=A0A2P5IEK4_DIAHE|nr:hypothetical protein DHEL01_v200686 [Diaporthe helianthi]
MPPPSSAGGHDVEDVSGFSRLFWPSTVPAPRVIGLHSRAEIPTSRSAVGGGVGDGASAQTAHMSCTSPSPTNANAPFTDNPLVTLRATAQKTWEDARERSENQTPGCLSLANVSVLAADHGREKAPNGPARCSPASHPDSTYAED